MNPEDKIRCFICGLQEGILAFSDTCELYWTLTTAIPASEFLIDVPW